MTRALVRALGALAAAAALAVAAPAAAKKSLPPGERIDLNRAPVSELMRLPGVGEKKAKAIVERRSKAPFRSLEEVTSVKGLGPKWLAKVRANVVVGAPAAPAQGTQAAASQRR